MFLNGNCQNWKGNSKTIIWRQKTLKREHLIGHFHGIGMMYFFLALDSPSCHSLKLNISFCSEIGFHNHSLLCEISFNCLLMNSQRAFSSLLSPEGSDLLFVNVANKAEVIVKVEPLSETYHL